MSGGSAPPAGFLGPVDGCFYRWAGTVLEARCGTPGVWGAEKRAAPVRRMRLSGCDHAEAMFPAHCRRLELQVDLASREVAIGFSAGTPAHMLGARIVALVVRAEPGGEPRFRWVGHGFEYGPRFESELPAPGPPGAAGPWHGPVDHCFWRWRDGHLFEATCATPPLAERADTDEVRLRACTPACREIQLRYDWSGVEENHRRRWIELRSSGDDGVPLSLEVTVSSDGARFTWRSTPEAWIRAHPPGEPSAPPSE